MQCLVFKEVKESMHAFMGDSVNKGANIPASKWMMLNIASSIECDIGQAWIILVCASPSEVKQCSVDIKDPAHAFSFL